MFANSFQNGPFFEIFDPKEACNKANKEKERFYCSLYKVNTPPHCQKVFDKILKGYVFDIDGHNTKVQFPRDDKVELCLVQQYLVLQVLVPPSQPWTLELVVTDTSKTKRRIILTSSVKGLEKKFFHVKVPIDVLRRGSWINLAIDVWSFMEGWKGQTFRSLDMIVVSSPCRLRKIFQLRNPPFDEGDEEITINISSQPIPKNVGFPTSYQASTQIITYRSLTEGFQHIPEAIEPIEQSGDQFIQKKNVYQLSQTQQKSSGFKRKTPQIQDKTTRGSSMEKSESNEDSQNIVVKRTNALKDNNSQKQQQQEFQNEFQEVEENIEGENNDDIVRHSNYYEQKDNQFEHGGDDLDQFQLNSGNGMGQNDGLDIIGFKLQPSLQFNLHNILHLERDNKDNKKPPVKQRLGVDAQGNQTGNAFTNPPSQSILNHQNTSENKRQQAQQLVKSPKIQAVELKKNPWGAKVNRISGVSKQTTESSRSPMANPRGRNSKDTDIDESLEQQQLDQQSTQKNPFMKGIAKQQNQLNQQNQQNQRGTKEKAVTPVAQKNKSRQRQVQQMQSAKQDNSPDEYLKMTQKFTTITDAQVFMSQQSHYPTMESNNRSKVGRLSYDDDEIEENIVDENTLSIKNQESQNKIIKSKMNQELLVVNNFNKRSISELKNESDLNYNFDELQDSLEMGPITNSYSKSPAYTYSQNTWKLKKQDESETTFTDGFYAKQLKKYTEVLHRPFTPDYKELLNYLSFINRSVNLNEIDRKGVKEIIMEDPDDQKEEQMVEVVYDPVMNCYYDPQTKQYYELKE